jgi:hypothetical protein
MRVLPDHWLCCQQQLQHLGVDVLSCCKHGRQALGQAITALADYITPRPWQRGTTLVRRHIARLLGSGQSAVGGTGVGWMITGQLV